MCTYLGSKAGKADIASCSLVSLLKTVDPPQDVSGCGGVIEQQQAGNIGLESFALVSFGFQEMLPLSFTVTFVKSM